MPKYSRFTRYGHLRFSGSPSHGEKIQKAIENDWGGQFSTAEGSRSEAWIYATAMGLARAKNGVEHCANQMDPHRTVDMLPVREATFGLNPGPKDSIFDRQDALSAKMLLPAGASYLAVINALQKLLGSDFLAYRTTKLAEIVAFPASPGAGPGNWVRNIAPKLVRLTAGISITGTPTPALYEPIDVALESVIQAGDVIVVSANNIGLAERVTVADSAAGTFTATFAHAHDPGDICTTGYFPYWTSTQKHSLVVVTPACALDRDKRRKINVLMAQIATGVSTWDIVPSADGAHTDAFTVQDAVNGRIGFAGLTSLTFP